MKITGGGSAPALSSEYRKNEYLGSVSEISLANPFVSVVVVPANCIVSVATSIL